MKKALCRFLACALLLAQFTGCASAPHLTRPTEISENEPSTVATVSPTAITYGHFSGKIAELKGKIQQRHVGDTAFYALSRRIDNLDKEQYALDNRKWHILNYSMYGGGVLAMAPAIALAADAATAEPGSSAKFVLYMASLPFLFSFGAGLGFLCAAGSYDYKVPVSRKNELVRLIDTYNELNNESTRATLPDTSKTSR